MNICIIGASGYSGVELIKILAAHSAVNLKYVTSRSLAGQSVAEQVPQLSHALKDLKFIASDLNKLPALDADIFFLALPHGVASTYAEVLVKAGKKVIDLSADFRLNSAETYKEYYGQEHPNKELLANSVYVIPELTPKEKWHNQNLIACPGCYPTSIIVPLYPLLKEKVIPSNGIIANSYSGISGAGKKVEKTYMYCERDGSATAYGIPKHRHLSEIEEQLSDANGNELLIQFNPHLAPMKRGILTTITLPSLPNTSEKMLLSILNKYYDDKPFVNILAKGKFPDTNHVVGTNRIDISLNYDPRTKNIIINSAEDNLLKGASGQAVQIMNLLIGCKETEGLIA